MAALEASVANCVPRLDTLCQPMRIQTVPARPPVALLHLLLPTSVALNATWFVHLVIAAVGTYDELASAVEARFGGLSDTLALGFGAELDPGVVRELVQDLKRIPAAFEGYATEW